MQYAAQTHVRRKLMKHSLKILLRHTFGKYQLNGRYSMNIISRRLMLGGFLPAGLIGLALSGRAKAADQPHMDAALSALKLARRELDQAIADKGGHRAKAIGLVNDAIVEVEKGIKFAKEH
jgi:hypothetical protein